MTKRLVTIALIVIMLTALALPAALAYDDTIDPNAGYYYVRTDNGLDLNVRDAPNGKVVGTLRYGTRIYVDAFSNPEWALTTFRYNNGAGYGEYAAWVSTRYITRENPGAYQTASVAAPSSSASAATGGETLDSINAIFRTAKQVASPYVVVSRPSRASGWVNLRWAPSSSAERIATCPQGKTLLVLVEMRGWYQVKDPATGMIGFISSKFVQKQ